MYEGVRQIFAPLVQKKIREVVGAEHLPSRPPFILAANHVGFLDPIVLTVFILNRMNRPLYMPTTPRMWKVWGGAWLTRRWLGMIPLQPGRFSQVVNEAEEVLKRGEAVGIFPEGTRNTDHELLRGKTGAVRLALATGAPLIPMGIFNNFGHRLGETIISLFRPSRVVKLVIGPEVPMDEFRGKSVDKPLLDAATSKLMHAISALCGKVYNY